LATALVCAGLTLTTGPAQAAPTWLPPFDVSAPDGQVTDFAATMAGDGTVWSSWPTQDAGGNALLALAQRAPGGGVAHVAPLVAGTVPAAPDLAIASDGRLVAAWLDADPATGEDPVVQFGARNADGSVAVQTLASTGAGDTDVLAGPGGLVAVAWSAGADQDEGEIDIRISHDNGATFGPVVVASTDRNAADPAMALEGDGTIDVVWSRLDVNEAGRVRITRIHPNGVVDARGFVSPAGLDASDPAVVWSPSLGTVVAWASTNPQEDSDVFVDAVGDVVAPAAVPSTGDEGTPDLALDAGGNLWVTWIVENGDSDTVLAATRSALTYGAPTTLSGADVADEPQLGFDGAGNGVVVWHKLLDPTDPTAGGDVRAAGFDGAPPAITAFTVPATAKTGTPAAFSLTATDVWSAVSPAGWNFGDGATATGDAVSHTYTDPGARTVTATVTDAVGNTTSRSGPVDVTAPAPPPSTTTPSSTTPSTTTPAPVQAESAPPSLQIAGFAKNFACVRFTGTGKQPGFEFSLSEAATVTLEIRRRVPSMTLSRCPGPPATKVPGTYEPALTVQQDVGPGSASVSFGEPGQLDQAAAASVRRRSAARRAHRATAAVRTRALKQGRWRLSLAKAAAAQQLAPGTYIATLTARTADGRIATTGHLKFWILTPRP